MSINVINVKRSWKCLERKKTFYELVLESKIVNPIEHFDRTFYNNNFPEFIKHELRKKLDIG